MRFGAFLVAVLFAVPAFAKHKNPPPPKRLLQKPAKKLGLSIESFDLMNFKMNVLVSGVARPPEARLFTFTDEKERKWIALDESCEAAEDKIRCTLMLPKEYLRSAPRRLTVTLRGREVAAPDDELRAKFEAAQQEEAAKIMNDVAAEGIGGPQN